MTMFLVQKTGIREMNKKHIVVDLLILAAILLIIATCSGCGPFTRYVHIHDRYPVYKTPEKTVLPKLSSEKLAPLDEETREQVTKAVKDLKSEAAQLRALLDSYNDYAKRKNAEYDQLFKKNKN